MKSVMGFRDGTEDVVPETTPAVTKADEQPVRSLVQVRISGSRLLTYYNDQFDLKAGDLVYVSGKLAGQIGRVETVTTRFRIRKADYERVIRRLDTTIRGTFEPADGFMVSEDPAAIPPERFRSWVIPPEAPKRRTWYVDPATGERRGFLETGTDADGTDDEIVVGDGYELSLADLEKDPEVRQIILDRAKDCIREKRIKYIRKEKDHINAFALGGSWYEVEFSLEDGAVSGLYCDCPYPGLCKHALAVLLTARDEMKEQVFNGDYTAVENDWFWSILTNRPQKITF